MLFASGVVGAAAFALFVCEKRSCSCNSSTSCDGPPKQPISEPWEHDDSRIKLSTEAVAHGSVDALGEWLLMA
jgi:hypothetical protein